MKLTFFTIEVGDKCYDLPKTMPVPQKGSLVFIDGRTGMVDSIHYHIERGKLFAISIFTTKPTAP